MELEQFFESEGRQGREETFVTDDGSAELTLSVVSNARYHVSGERGVQERKVVADYARLKLSYRVSGGWYEAMSVVLARGKGKDEALRETKVFVSAVPDEELRLGDGLNYSASASFCFGTERKGRMLISSYGPIAGVGLEEERRILLGLGFSRLSQLPEEIDVPGTAVGLVRLLRSAETVKVQGHELSTFPIPSLVLSSPK